MMKYISKSVLVAATLMFGVLATGCDSSDDTQPSTVVELAQDGGFDTLVAAVQAAGLVATLESDGPFTVFAPTEQAFAALPAGTLDDLLLPENVGLLTDILTYHVVAGRVTSEQVVMLSAATTLQGDQLDIEVVDGQVTVNGANVTQVDIEADNGVIHVIDAVLLPPAE